MNDDYPSWVLKRLEREYPKLSSTRLTYKSIHQLLIATILSAQCTDERVNKVTSSLFKRYPSISDFSNADQEELERMIFSTGFYHNKARNIIDCSQKIISDFDSRVPDEMKELIRLPGVGRKTANIVLSIGYGVDEGIAVDTHVYRLSRRLGLSKAKTPDYVEKDLCKAYPRKGWRKINNIFIEHGRRVCKSQKPMCTQCTLTKRCPKTDVKRFL